MPRPCEITYAAHRCITDAPLGYVDDTFELEIVEWIERNLQIGDRIFDFLALVEPRPTDHAVGQAHRHEAILERAHLERSAHQDCHVVQLVAALGQTLDVITYAASLFLVVPNSGNGHLVTIVAVSEECFAEAPLVVRDQSRRSCQNVAGRTVVALKPDHRGAGEIRFEPQDVVDLRSAPTVDRLVIVTNAADVWRALCQEAQP